MTFDYRTIPLPICNIVPDIRQKLALDNTLIINAPPGAGKSTLLPLALMDEPWVDGKKILMLEPRRLAARTIATRMAGLLAQEAGQTVGYRIRFDSCAGPGTRIEVVTKGILTRMLQNDNALENVAMVMFDEFHERSIYADVALALCRDAQQVLRPDLRIVVMSATLDMPQLSKLLNAPVAVSEGRLYPVDIVYTGMRDSMMLPELTARAAAKAVADDEGDILVFLPGEGEIRQTETLLAKNFPQLSIHPLYGQLPPSRQFAAIMPDHHGRRKIVLATSIAETSLTIEGIKVVIDTGYGRTLRFDPGTGLSRLATTDISKDAADQRAGRAGRLSAGKCYRMWDMVHQHRMADHRVPEIEESDLASLVLDMAQWGVADIQKLTWLTPPPKGHLAQATETLHDLDALKDGKITLHGRKMASLPCHPRLAHMLIMAQGSGQLQLGTDIAAVLEERDPLPRETGIDINLRIEALRRHRVENRDNKALNRIEKVAASYRKLFGIHADNRPFDPYDTGVLLVHAYPERIACARPGNNARFQLSNGSYAMALHSDGLAHEPWLAVAHLDARDGLGKIFLASPLNPKDLAPLVKQQQTVAWDIRKGGLAATNDLRIGSIVLQSKPIAKPDAQQVANAICDIVMKDGERLLDFNEEVEQWQNRVLSLRTWSPDDGWPDVSTPALLQTAHQWLAPYAGQAKKNEDLKKLNLLDIFHHQLDWEKQSRLDQLAPGRIEVPSGSKIKLQYQANGASPVLAVRLQEMFGLAETPCVNKGKIPVLLHLLSPGYKPVQVTSDLRSFWNHTYFEVKKELRTRYPKHVWPDDPWKEQAVKGVRRKS
ncbi:MAG: ATP-dependent helicase HrpB [Breznakibacter sp.]